MKAGIYFIWYLPTDFLHWTAHSVLASAAVAGCSPFSCDSSSVGVMGWPDSPSSRNLGFLCGFTPHDADQALLGSIRLNTDQGGTIRPYSGYFSYFVSRIRNMTSIRNTEYAKV
jgi:hypothetical protein